MLEIYNQSIELQGVINNYALLDYKKEMRGPGHFRLQLNAYKTNAEHLTVGNFVKIDELDGIINKREKRTNNGQAQLLIEGTYLISILNWRVTDELELSASAETLAKTIVDNNCVSSANTDRNFNNLTIDTDLNEGTATSIVTRKDPLLKVLEKVLSIDDYGHEIVIENGGLVYRVIKPVDRSNEVQFSNKLGNIQTSKEIVMDSNYRNYIYVEGDGLENSFGSSSGFDRRETYIKDTRIKTESGLQNKATQELSSKHKRTENVDATLKITNTLFEYGVDFSLGDTVSMVLSGNIYTTQVSELLVKRTGEEKELKLTFGTPQRGTTDMIKDIKEDVANQNKTADTSTLMKITDYDSNDDGTVDNADNATNADNADTVDGKHASESNVANTVVTRSSSGDIVVRLLRPEYTSNNTSPNHIMTQVETGSGTNNYVRPTSLATLKSALGSMPANGGNADTVDGEHASAFANAVHGHAYLPENDPAVGINGDDSRDNNYNPDVYMSSGARYLGRASVQSEFKYCNVINVDSIISSTYCFLMTYTPWSDGTGGYPIQMAMGSNGDFAIRTGTGNTTWGAWRKVYHNGNITSGTANPSGGSDGDIYLQYE